MCAFVRMLTNHEIMPDSLPIWGDGTQATQEECEEIIALARYEARRRAQGAWQARQRPARRRAYRLLRLFLSPHQNAELTRRRQFTVHTASGRVYRLRPRDARVEEVTRHGKHYFVARSFCLHPDDSHGIPDPDITLTHMLLLIADEEGFLQEAHVRNHRTDLWNGDYLRRMAAAQRQREEERHAPEVTDPRDLNVAVA